MENYGRFQADQAAQAYYATQWNRPPQPLSSATAVQQQWPMFPHFGQLHVLPAQYCRARSACASPTVAISTATEVTLA
jgi:hypothetical protein